MAKKIKFPDKVYPCGREFEVMVGKFKCENTYGETTGIEKKIIISSSIKKEKQKWNTLYHEYLHGIFHCTGLSEMMSGDLEEAIVVALEEHTFHLVDRQKLTEKP